MRRSLKRSSRLCTHTHTTCPLPSCPLPLSFPPTTTPSPPRLEPSVSRRRSFGTGDGGWLAGREGARLLTVILRSVCVDPDSLCRIARFPHKSPLARVVIPTFLHNWLPRVFLLQLSSSLRSHPSCATQLSTPTSSSYPDTLRRHTLTS